MGLGAIAGLSAALTVLLGGADWEWRSGFSLGGEPIHLRLDGLSALFLALLWVVGGAAPLLVPNALMVPAQRYIHIVEILTQNAALGITAVLLLRPRERSSIASEMATADTR